MVLHGIRSYSSYPKPPLPLRTKTALVLSHHYRVTDCQEPDKCLLTKRVEAPFIRKVSSPEHTVIKEKASRESLLA
jgi:hypothetical protein